MTAAELKAMYAGMCIMPLKIRRYSVAVGVRTFADFDVLGFFRLASGKEIADGIAAQGDQIAIVTADELARVNFALPITVADKVVTDRERAIQAPIGERKALDGTLVAYDLQARG